MVDFGNLLANLNNMGFYQYVLPWILFLVILFALLEKAGLFGNKKINVIVSAIISFFIINYSGLNIGTALTEFFGGTSLYMAGLLILILFLQLGGLKVDKAGEFLGKEGVIIVGLILATVIIMVFLGATGQSLNIDDQTASILFVVVLVVGTMLFLGKEEKK